MLLQTFFAPVPFGFEDATALRKGILEFHNTKVVRASGAMLSPGRTFAVVCESIKRRDEPGGRPVHEYLESEAKVLAGPAVPEEGGGVPVLFGEVLAEQVRRSALDRLLAAWFYLDGRHKLLKRWDAGQVAADDPDLQALQRVSHEISARLRNVQGNDYESVASEIRAAMNRFQSK